MVRVRTRIAMAVFGYLLATSACAPTPDTSTAQETLVDPPVGAIVPSAPIGTLPGTMSVGSDGSGRYSVPLEVPPGRMGIQPSLSLEYSSNAANGLLGVGWSLAG